MGNAPATLETQKHAIVVFSDEEVRDEASEQLSTMPLGLEGEDKLDEIIPIVRLLEFCFQCICKH